MSSISKQRAQEASKIDEAIRKLTVVKGLLSRRNSLQTVRLTTVISELEEIRDILNDPDCEG